jgi:hydrogenase maturation protease
MSTSNRPTRRTVVIGLGSPLMGDDGLGLAALARLQEQWTLPATVELVDGGTWGMNLLPVIEDADRLLLLDAIHANAPAGTLIVLDRARIPRYLAMKISPHQVDLRDVLGLAELRGTLPEETVALGLQPARVELAHELSAALRDHLDDLVAAAVRQLEEWGHVCLRQEAPVHA